MNDSWRTIHNPVIGDTMTFLRTQEETGGELTELEIELAPGGGNPLHFHRTYSERFEVLTGRLGVQAGTDERTLAAGETALIEPGMHHRFFNPGDEPVRFRVEIRPGHAGFERSMRILYGLARDGRTNGAGMPKSLSHTAVAAELSEMGAAGALGLLQPLLRYLARRARKNGVERSLLEQYCSMPEGVAPKSPSPPTS